MFLKKISWMLTSVLFSVMGIINNTQCVNLGFKPSRQSDTSQANNSYVRVNSSTLNRLQLIRFNNDIQMIPEVFSDQPIISRISPLINGCSIYVNGVHIPHGSFQEVPVVDYKCTVTITARLDHFDPIFNLNFLVKKVAPYIRGHLIFSYELSPEDIENLGGNTDIHIEVSNVIIDLIDKYKLLEGNTDVPYKAEFMPIRNAKIIILDR
jgi:hypothetical protein